MILKGQIINMGEKIFLTWNKQVEKLESRNICFRTDEERKNAKFALQNNSYYALVNGYKDFFCILDESGEDDYQHELFVDLRDTFDFDKELSALVFKYLLRIEDSIKAIFSYYIGEQYGHKDTDYLDVKKYRKGNYVAREQKFEVDILLEKLNRTIDMERDLQIEHYSKIYGYVPPWVLASCLSMDTLMYWYKLSNRKIKEKTVQTMLYDFEQYPFTHITDIEENIELFTNLTTLIKEYRNRAAHGNRIINHSSKHNIKIHLLELYALNRKEIKGLYLKGVLKNDIFSLFVTIVIMLSKRETIRNNFIKEIEVLFYRFKIDNPALYKKVTNKVKLNDNFLEVLRGII
ncbi:Abi family protein [Enterococcus faecium]|uniref:Abi family protein n=1 Tax=Enterococcus faecium TaxID=1352 RepID=UPI002157AF57|nr:Abi family protein [Enterococcus faecium]